MPEGKLSRFLESFAKTESRHGDIEPGRRPFLTISRQVGAGGRALGERVVDLLAHEKDVLWHGWKVFDRELCESVAEDPELRVSLESLIKEEYRTPMGDFAAQLLAGATPQDVVLRKLFRLIRTLAGAGKVVIVGRGGCMAARGLPGGVHVRLVAPLEWRVRRMAEKLKADHAEAERYCRELDADRARLFKNRFRRDINDPLLFDAMFHTESSSFDEIAAAVVGMLKARTARLEEEAAEKTDSDI